MRIYPINTATNRAKPNFKANSKSTKPIQKIATDKGYDVLRYIEQGCPKTDKGEEIFNKLFVPEIFDLYTISTCVGDLLKRCGDNVEVISRALGNYGLELYGELPQGSTIKNARKEIIETGYWSKYDDLNTNFMNYLDYNPSGKLSEIEERFGSHSSMWLNRYEAVGQIHTTLHSYKVINDMGDCSSISVQAKTLRANAIRKLLDKINN